jgi:hypothetical protein
VIVDGPARPWMWTTLLVTGGALAAYALVLRKNGSGTLGPIIAFAAGPARSTSSESCSGFAEQARQHLGRAARWARAHVGSGAGSRSLAAACGVSRTRNVSIALTVVLGGVTASGLVGLALQQSSHRDDQEYPRETI